MRSLPCYVLSLTAAAVTLVLAPKAKAAPDAPPGPKKVVLLAGPKSHGPEGNGIHDYGWSVRLLKVMLDRSSVRDRVNVEYHLNGWPKDQRGLEDADTIVVISDGRDGDKFSEALHLESDERVAFVGRQMKRGCGLVTFHFSTFAPERYADRVLDWTGGYFQWEKEGKRDWSSAITTVEAEVRPASPGHPVSRGVKPFTMKEEFYYNLRFRDLKFDGAAEGTDQAGTRPLWVVAALPGREPDGRVVAWARQRPDGGRAFGTSCGHFYDNWRHEEFRMLVLNGIVWSAGAEVPEGGVRSDFVSREEIVKALGPAGGTKPESGRPGQSR